MSTPFALGFALMLVTGTARELTPQRLQTEILTLGAWGLVGFLAASTIRPFFLVLSGSLFAVAAGLVWGPWTGTLVALLGSVLSAIVLCGFVRSFGAGVVREVAGARYERFSLAAQNRGFALVFVASLGFLFPTDLIISVASVAGVSKKSVVLAATLGTLPGSLAMSILGAETLEPTPYILVMSGAVMVGLTVLSVVLARLFVFAPRTQSSRLG